MRQRWLSRALERWILVLVVATASGVWPTCAFGRPPDPWPGPEGAYVFAEAEQFEIEGAGWQVVESARGFYAVPASGMKALSGAGPGEGSASLTLDVPAAGDYRLWVRYAQWQAEEQRWRAPFRLAIEQGGEEVFAQVYDETLDVETPGGRAWQPPFRWQAVPVTLAEGKASIALSKAAPAAVDRRLRRIDCVLLTTDADYEPNERDFAPQTYLRARLHSADPERVYFYVFLDHMRAPWYQNTCWAKDGLRLSVVAPEDQYLAAGDQTPWMNISRLLYTDSVTGFSVHATVRYRHPDASASDYSLDFATAPSEEAIVKTVRRSGPGNGVQLTVPPDLSEGKLPKADAEYAREVADFIARLEPIGFGRRPRRFPLMVNLHTSKAANTPGARELEFVAIRYMGINAMARHISDEDLADGVRFGRTGASIWHMGPAGYNEPDLARMEQSVRASGERARNDPHADALISVVLMDEAGAKNLAAMAESEVDQRAFAEWIRAQGPSPEALGAGSWEEFKLTADPAAQPPALYYWSQRFRAWSVANFFRQATELVRKYYPPHIKATQNYSDGAVWMGNFYVQGNDYYVWLKNRALDIAMSEDWTNGGATPQLCGWNVALLRSAAKYHHQPIHMYVIASYGRRPLDVKLKAYSDLAQGAKMLHFYSYAPIYSSHERGWHQNWTMYPAVAELCHEIGAAEDVLVDALPRPGRTAIIYSIASDIWNTTGDIAQCHERMMTYLALRHAQVAVDVLSDEDVAEGRLTPYRVAYLFGEQLDGRVVPPLAAWVKAGGTLVLSPGAGSKDRFNQPTAALDEALGISREPMQVEQAYAHSSYFYVQGLQPRGRVTLLDAEGRPRGAADLLAHSQRFALPAGARVLATFEDGAPAALAVDVEKGRAVLVGFMPALAYVRGAVLDFIASAGDELVEPLRCVARAMEAATGGVESRREAALRQPRRDYSAAPFRYDPALREFIAFPHTAAGVVEPVELDTPQVEATFMEGAEGWAVPLANYSGGPLGAVRVTIRPGRPHGDVFSARQGRLTPGIAPDGSLQLTLPLESTDIIYARWQRS